MDYLSEGTKILRALAGAKDDIADRADGAARYASTEAKDVGRIVSRFVVDLSEALSARSATAGKSALSTLAATSEMSRDGALAAQKVMVDEIRARPLQTVMAVAAAGVILGWLFKK